MYVSAKINRKYEISIVTEHLQSFLVLMFLSLCEIHPIYCIFNCEIMKTNKCLVADRSHMMYNGKGSQHKLSLMIHIIYSYTPYSIPYIYKHWSSVFHQFIIEDNINHMEYTGDGKKCVMYYDEGYW